MEIILINEELFRENSPIKDDTIITKFVPYISIVCFFSISLGFPGKWFLRFRLYRNG